jgi:uncharacterized protein DUF1905/bacteriocin resistance YdeI/OmpD-like protein
MRQTFKIRLEGDRSGKMGTASFTLPFDTRAVWGKARVPVKVSVNRHTWRSTVANRGGKQYIVVNAEARRGAGVKAGDVVTVTLEPYGEKREVDVPPGLKRALGAPLARKLEALAFTHQKEFVRWYAGAKKEETRARRVEKMRAMLASGNVIT